MAIKPPSADDHYDGGRTTRRSGGSRKNPRHDYLCPHIDDILGRVTKSESLHNLYIHDAVVLAHPDARPREWYKRSVQEFCLALNWKTFDHEIHIRLNGAMPRFQDYFFIEFPLTTGRKQRQYSANSCRVYPGKIMVPGTSTERNIAIFDIASENRYLKFDTIEMANNAIDKHKTLMTIEAVVEKRHKSFFDGINDHEVVIQITQRLPTTKGPRRSDRAS